MMTIHLALLAFLSVVVIFSMCKANAKGKAIGKDIFRVGLPAFLLQEVQNIFSPLPGLGRFRSDSQHGRPTAWVLRLSWVGAILFGCLTHDARAAIPSLITTSVGQQSSPLSVTVTLSASGVAIAPQALLQGYAGMDFSVVSGGTCAATVSYVSGQQCTVNVVFAPKFPGLRSGAVVLLATDGSLLGSALVDGNAIGSLSVLSPGVINTVAGDGELNFRADNVPATQAPIFLPYGVIVDPAGNLLSLRYEQQPHPPRRCAEQSHHHHRGHWRIGLLRRRRSGHRGQHQPARRFDYGRRGQHLLCR
jgi:hypothetical protein